MKNPERVLLGATVIIPPSRVNNGIACNLSVYTKKLYLSYAGLYFSINNKKINSKNFILELDVPLDIIKNCIFKYIFKLYF